ncbi:MAG: hypothetical protein CMO97_00990 [Woeseia sp.]|nr:hypothetical protein [Woeseia sp.]|tara:strand:- start:48 stop:545 length:498 start_codon:yes stop_codon:yes gene_type:complete
MISIIVAASKNNVIGLQGELPWNLSNDLKRFKTLTMGKPIIMGRLTWESIGRPLPGRKNIIISRQENFKAEGGHVVGSHEEAINLTNDAKEIMVIGGSQIYNLFLPISDKLYLTRVHAEIKGDTFFPEIKKNQWKLIDSQKHKASDMDQYDYEFISYVRINQLET